jgi:XTP/dITP diphosphohydrolase
MNKIIVASNNQGKIKEFKQILNSQFDLISMSELNIQELPETGLTFVENAIIKARNASKQSGLPAIADDSGLVVDALNGEPGIYSARYSDSKDDISNTEKVLHKMRNIPHDKRTARFWCAIVFMRHYLDPNPIIIQKGWEGLITYEPKGKNGFGYDPIFYVPTHDQVSAELDPVEKNKISHRGQALKALIQELALPS